MMLKATVAQKDNMQVRTKGLHDDVVTCADLDIQRMVLTNLRRIYHHMRVVGEEDENHSIG